MSLRSASFALLLMACASAPAGAQARGATPPNPAPPAADSTPKVETAGEKEEKISKTTHTLRLDGRDIKYTATTGTLPIRLDNGQVAARMFFVAYTKDGEDVKTRPVSFLYNGGPGAATIWLHMGSFAPRARRDGRRRLSAGAAVSPGGQRELAARCHRHGVRRRRRHRLQPRGGRRRQQAVPRRPRRPSRVRRVHQRLSENATAAFPHRNI